MRSRNVEQSREQSFDSTYEGLKHFAAKTPFELRGLVFRQYL